MSKAQNTARAVVEPVAEAVEETSAPAVADPWASLRYDSQDWDDVVAVLEERRADLYEVVSIVAGANPVSDAEQLGELALEPLSTLRERVQSMPGPADVPRWVRAKDKTTKRVRINGKLRAYRPAPFAPPVAPAHPQSPPTAPAQPAIAPSHVYAPQAAPWPYPAPPPPAHQGFDLAALGKTLAAELGAVLGGAGRPVPGLGEFPSWLQPILAELFRQRTAATEDAVSIGRSRYDQGFEDGRRIGMLEGKIQAMRGRPSSGDDDEDGGTLLKALAPVLTQLGANLGGKTAAPTTEPAKEEAKPAPAAPASQQFDVAKVLRQAIETGSLPKQALGMLEVIHPDAVRYLVENRAMVVQLAPSLPDLAPLLSTSDGVEWMQQLGDELAARAGAA